MWKGQSVPSSGVILACSLGKILIWGALHFSTFLEKPGTNFRDEDGTFIYDYLLYIYFVCFHPIKSCKRKYGRFIIPLKILLS